MQRKPTMRKNDVEIEIGRVFKSEFMNYELSGSEKRPVNIYDVYANIMDDEYYGEGTYQLKIDFYGDVPIDNDKKESMRGHFEITSEVDVTPNSEKSPIIKIKTPFVLRKKPY